MDMDAKYLELHKAIPKGTFVSRNTPDEADFDLNMDNMTWRDTIAERVLHHGYLQLGPFNINEPDIIETVKAAIDIARETKARIIKAVEEARGAASELLKARERTTNG